MSWAEITRLNEALRRAVIDAAPLASPWAAYRDAVLRSRDDPPYHLRRLLALAETAAEGARREDVVILDHGCGGAATLLYLLALGYRGVHGVDVIGATCEIWNRLMREVFRVAEPRFQYYDGTRLPLADASVDLLFSQQVVEHVRPHLLDAYYAEEGRVLKPGGIAFHQVPHRFVPYDSHTRTWFVHYLPRPLALRVHARLGSDRELVREALFLRSPGVHRALVRRHLGQCRDLTVARLTEPMDMAYYDGPAGLRRLIGRLVTAPGIGPVFAALLRNLVMLDTMAIKDETAARR